MRRDQVLAWWSSRSRLPKPLLEQAEELDEKIAGIERDGRAICAAFLDFAASTR